MRYRVEVKDPIGNTIRIDHGAVSDAGGEFVYDFRNPGSAIGGAIIGTVKIEREADHPCTNGCDN